MPPFNITQTEDYDDSNTTSLVAPNLALSILFWCIIVVIFVSLCISRQNKGISRTSSPRSTMRHQDEMHERSDSDITEPLPIYSKSNARVIDSSVFTCSEDEGGLEGMSVYTCSHSRFSGAVHPPSYQVVKEGTIEKVISARESIG